MHAGSRGPIPHRPARPATAATALPGPVPTLARLVGSKARVGRRVTDYFMPVDTFMRRAFQIRVGQGFPNPQDERSHRWDRWCQRHPTRHVVVDVSLLTLAMRSNHRMGKYRRAVRRWLLEDLHGWTADLQFMCCEVWGPE